MERAGDASTPGTEELGHLEMIGSIVHQLTRGLTDEQIRTSGFAPYFVDHTTGIYPTAAPGAPWNAAGIGVKGDVIADLTEDMAAEQKARVTYDNILRLSDDPDVSNVIKFLRAREVVHFQRFGEAKRTKGTSPDSGESGDRHASAGMDRSLHPLQGFFQGAPGTGQVHAEKMLPFPTEFIAGAEGHAGPVDHKMLQRHSLVG